IDDEEPNEKEEGLALLYLVSIFLRIAYILSFALAFHNNYTVKSTNRAALYFPYDDVYGNHANTPDVQGKHTSYSSVKPLCSPSNPARMDEYLIHFSVGSAILNAGILCENSAICPAGVVDSKDKGANDNVETMCQIVSHIIYLWNKENTKEKKAKEDEAKENKDHIIVKLVGQASSENTAGRYASNYELSKARAEQVKCAIAGILSGKYKLSTNNLLDKDIHICERIAWEIIPLSSEIAGIEQEKFKSVKKPKNLKNQSNPDQRVVAVSIIETNEYLPECLTKNEIEESLKPLDDKLSAIAKKCDVINKDTPSDTKTKNETDDKDKKKREKGRLLDYFYFMIYTITTTGYGDIIPMSAMAKFMTCIANIYEVLFMIIFVNVLMILHSRKDDTTI
ncbi:MAG: potassium channel family protein, partial [Dehalococcoidales bacterium]|nr:potassium channel family protein [Dehalococcoidales bacterium]